MRKSMIHVSFDPVEAFVPRVPSQRIEGEMEEDSVTKRICASSTILGALRGIPCGGEVLYQMQRLEIPLLIHAYYMEGKYIAPTEQQVPDRCVTDEVWFLKTPEKIRVFGYKEVYFLIWRYSPVQGLCRLFLFIVFFLFRLRVSRQMDFSHEVKDNIHFLKTLAVYLLRRMDNDFLYKLIDDSGR